MHFNPDVALADRRRAQVKQPGGTGADEHYLVRQPFGRRCSVDHIAGRNEAKTLLRPAKRNVDRNLFVDRNIAVAETEGLEIDAAPSVAGEAESDGLESPARYASTPTPASGTGCRDTAATAARVERRRPNRSAESRRNHRWRHFPAARQGCPCSRQRRRRARRTLRGRTRESGRAAAHP